MYLMLVYIENNEMNFADIDARLKQNHSRDKIYNALKVLADR